MITEDMVKSLFPRLVPGASKVWKARKEYKAGRITQAKMKEIYFYYTK